MELLFHVLEPISLPYTILLGIVILFWLTVILGAFDIEVFDFEVEADGFWSFLNLGTIPFSIWLSVFTFQIWLYSLVISAVLNNFAWLIGYDSFRFLLGAIILIPLVTILTKVITKPLKRLLETNESLSKADFIGKTCLITSRMVSPKSGIARVHTGASPIIINVRAELSEGLKKNSEALIYEYDKEKDIFYVSSYNGI